MSLYCVKYHHLYRRSIIPSSIIMATVIIRAGKYRYVNGLLPFPATVVHRPFLDSPSRPLSKIVRISLQVRRCFLARDWFALSLSSLGALSFDLHKQLADEN